MRLQCENINPLNAELNPICHLLALLGAHHILHVSRIRVNFIRLMGKGANECFEIWLLLMEPECDTELQD
jgi:hypothetical protein